MATADLPMASEAYHPFKFIGARGRLADQTAIVECLMIHLAASRLAGRTADMAGAPLAIVLIAMFCA
ncbi:hypothetical protein [Sphingomonas sp.]|uniref:hypothetical protein n=1 Tax=Sphingomonas sp. TaxID=28214 RepID=UPI0025E9FE8B|nr:hypothetical protein [Sphingomonas sp.]